jgi:hypothetical protein
MSFRRTSIIRTDPLGYCLCSQHPGRFHHRTFPVPPLGLDRVQPGTFTRQSTRDDAHPTPAVFDAAVVGAQPRLDRLALVPRGMVPHPQHGVLPQVAPAVTAPGQKLGREAPDRVPRRTPPPELFRGGGGGPPQQPRAGQGLGIGIGLGPRFFHHTQRLPSRRPGVQGGLRPATPPDLITTTERPCGMGRRQTEQAGPLVFFRAYAGAGLVIHCLARCHRTPRRASARRMVSPLTCRDVRPAVYATSAASGKVHRLVGVPKVRGGWCNKARSCSHRVRSKAACGVRCGAEDRGVSAASPGVWHACMAWRTV